MGIRTFTFGGTSSGNYNMFITSASAYGAPERAVEMMEIPGRNGHYALDHGRFENVEVTYHVVVHDDNNTSFQSGMSDVRNWLCSQIGYQRLEDDYNANEYRMAVYRSGLEVEGEDTFWNGAEFDIVFDCKPQRWLTSGEVKSSISSGSSVTNPTLFDAHPLIEFKGYGNISIGGKTINVASIPIGNILLSNGSTFTVKNQTSSTPIHTPAEIGSITIDISNLNAGDNIYVAESQVTYNFRCGRTVTSTSVTNESGEAWTTKSAIPSDTSAYFTTVISAQTFLKGTSATKTYEYKLDLVYGYSSTGATMTIKMEYNGSDKVTLYASLLKDSGSETWECVGKIAQINAFSTKVANNTFYVDFDIGEAYFANGASYTNANYAVSIPAILPKLQPGNNTITYDNTITNFKMAPRWWKV